MKNNSEVWVEQKKMRTGYTTGSCAAAAAKAAVCMLLSGEVIQQVRLMTPKGVELDLEVEHVKFFKQFVIVKFKEFDNINEIEKYRRCPLLVTREHAVKLEENEYFIADMIGMEVFTEDGSSFGILKDVIETGANDVYVIDSHAHEEVLIPAIKECILDVDVENQKMTIHLMDGLV